MTPRTERSILIGSIAALSLLALEALAWLNDKLRK